MSLLRIIMILESISKAFTAHRFKTHSAGKASIDINHIGADHAQKLMITHGWIIYLTLHKELLGYWTTEIVLRKLILVRNIMTLETRIASILLILILLMTRWIIYLNIIFVWSLGIEGQHWVLWHFYKLMCITGQILIFCSWNK